MTVTDLWKWRKMPRQAIKMSCGVVRLVEPSTNCMHNAQCAKTAEHWRQRRGIFGVVPFLCVISFLHLSTQLLEQVAFSGRFCQCPDNLRSTADICETCAQFLGAGRAELLCDADHPPGEK